MTTLTYQAGDRGRTVSLAVGARFVVALEENPTTGYKWSAPAFEGVSLALEADDYTLAKGAAIGGGGIRKFGFVVKSIGKTTIRLEYRRPWERGVAPEATFELKVVGTR